MDGKGAEDSTERLLASTIIGKVFMLRKSPKALKLSSYSSYVRQKKKMAHLSKSFSISSRTLFDIKLSFSARDE